MRVRRLLPEPGDVEAAAAFDDLALIGRSRTGRPYVVANMVATVDGRAAIGGRSGPVSSDVDRVLFHSLRGQVDAILAGTGTLRAERYGRMVRDPERRAAREAAGLVGDPLAVVISRTLDVPWDIPLFADESQRVVVYTSADGEPPATTAPVSVTRVATDHELRPSAVMRDLGAQHGVRAVLCEGGPRMLAAFVADGALDELFLSVSPVLAGGDDPLTILLGEAPDNPVRLELAGALTHEGELYLRYALRRGGS